MSILDNDGARTPVDLGPELLVCDIPGCTKGPNGGPYVAKTKQGLGTHRFTAHGVRAGMSRGETPPGGAPPKTPPRDTPPPPDPKKHLGQSLQASFSIIGVGVGMLEPYDGKCITAGAKNLGAALEALVEQYPAIRPYVEMLAFDTPAFAVVLALLPIVLPMLKHHGIIKVDLPAILAGPHDVTVIDPDGSEHKPAPGAAPDLSALLGMIDPNMMAAAFQHAAGAARPMGEGAPDDAVTVPVGASPDDELE